LWHSNSAIRRGVVFAHNVDRNGFFALIFSLAAIITISLARHELSHAARNWQGGNGQLAESHSHLATFLLYAAWIFAVGGAEYLWLTRHSRRPGLAWLVAGLLGIFFYLSLVA
jgi:hypothetical protein